MKYLILSTIFTGFGSHCFIMLKEQQSLWTLEDNYLSVSCSGAFYGSHSMQTCLCPFADSQGLRQNNGQRRHSLSSVVKVLGEGVGDRTIHHAVGQGINPLWKVSPQRVCVCVCRRWSAGVRGLWACVCVRHKLVQCDKPCVSAESVRCLCIVTFVFFP